MTELIEQAGNVLSESQKLLKNPETRGAIVAFLSWLGNKVFSNKKSAQKELELIEQQKATVEIIASLKSKLELVLDENDELKKELGSKIQEMNRIINTDKPTYHFYGEKSSSFQGNIGGISIGNVENMGDIFLGGNDDDGKKKVNTMTGRKSKKCFILSVLNRSEKTYECVNRAMNNIVIPTMEKLNYIINRSDNFPQAGELPKQIIQNIVDSDIVIADITGFNPNVFYEISFCHAIRKPVIQIMKREDSAKIPFYLDKIRTVLYTHSHEDVKNATEEICKLVESIENGEYHQYEPAIRSYESYNKALRRSFHENVLIESFANGDAAYPFIREKTLEAKESILLAGVCLALLKEDYYPLLKELERLNNNLKIEFSVADPTTDILKTFKEYIYKNKSSGNCPTPETIWYMFKNIFIENEKEVECSDIELKLFKFPATFASIIIDNKHIFVYPYGYGKKGSESPVFYFVNENTPASKFFIEVTRSIIKDSDVDYNKIRQWENWRPE
jgi:nucleoside 2-deoxyribosyltransferase